MVSKHYKIFMMMFSMIAIENSKGSKFFRIYSLLYCNDINLYICDTIICEIQQRICSIKI